MASTSGTALRETASEEETRQIGARIGARACHGDTIGLIGDLGGGKTTFAQGIGEGLGLPVRAISSPTFTLIAEHLEGRMPLYHLDVYRLECAADLYHLGFEDYLLRSDGLIIIEWADKVAKELPADRLDVVFEEVAAGPDRRALRFFAGGPRSARLLREALAVSVP